MDARQLRRLIKEVLGDLDYPKNGDLWSEGVEELLMITAAQETRLGEYLYQINGPARGIFQMEPKTDRDIWDNYLRYKQDLAEEIHKFVSPHDDVLLDLTANLPYQIVMARVHYLRDPHPIPEATEIMALCSYYKRVWNTYAGKATIDQAYKNWKELVYRPWGVQVGNIKNCNF